jgi:hypothetical protein
LSATQFAPPLRAESHKNVTVPADADRRESEIAGGSEQSAADIDGVQHAVSSSEHRGHQDSAGDSLPMICWRTSAREKPEPESS